MRQLGQTGSLPGIEPLDPELWFQALERLSSRISASNDNDVESMLRHALHLVQLTPGPLKGVVRCEIGEDAFEAFLERGAFDSAAIALVGSPMCYELNCALEAGRRVIEARAWIPSQAAQPGPAAGECLASALLGAWTGCLVALRRRSLASEAPVLHQFPRTARHERHQKSTGH
ncbi:MAG TPA: hypothetical protein VHD34_02725 [Xanthobacteraceae bacterium]|nr:hypothetical protein [Xanthobacteraceae bacterium]